MLTIQAWELDMTGAVSHSPNTFQRLKFRCALNPQIFLYEESIKDLTCLPVAASSYYITCDTRIKDTDYS